MTLFIFGAIDLIAPSLEAALYLGFDNFSSSGLPLYTPFKFFTVSDLFVLYNSGEIYMAVFLNSIPFHSLVYLSCSKIHYLNYCTFRIDIDTNVLAFELQQKF